jgi:hypothetical protein
MEFELIKAARPDEIPTAERFRNYSNS